MIKSGQVLGSFGLEIIRKGGFPVQKCYIQTTLQAIPN